MNTEYFKFSVGGFECTSISDGAFTYAPPDFPPPASFLFLNIPPEHIGQALSKIGLKAEGWMEWTSSYTCLLVNTGKYKVLIDTGAGNLDASTGRLRDNLINAGVSHQEIDIIILTHGHPDHIGGNINPAGEIAFPKARWVMCKEEWQFWTSNVAEKQLAGPGSDMLISIARKNLLPLERRIDLLEKEMEITPGVTAIMAPGHTPGQIALKISSEDKHLLYISDIVLHPLHLENPEWCAAVDIVPDQQVHTRYMLLPKIAAENTLVMSFHFPFPGLGYIVPKGNTWTWRPLF